MLTLLNMFNMLTDKKQAVDDNKGDDIMDQSVEEKLGTKYKWKRKIPASRFGNVVKAAGKRKQEDFTNEILSFDFSGDTEATKYGKEHEKDALEQLAKQLGVEIVEPKKTVDKEHKFLVCIPDGLIDTDKLVEIKCPYKCLTNSMESLAKSDDKFCLGLTAAGQLKLKKEHNYYYQVQGELNICQRDMCYFVVWSPDQFHCEVIQRDTHFWEVNMFPWLLDFYRVHILDDKWKVPDIPEDMARTRANDVLSRLRSSQTQHKEIEKATRGQGKNIVWAKERKGRLTASNFGRVVKMRPTTSCQNTVVSMLYPDSLDRIEAIRYGKEHEADAIETLNTILAKSRVSVEECGLFVDPKKGYLAGTPDGTVGKDALVEVKCPMKCTEHSIEDLARTDSTFCLEYDTERNAMQLKKSHNYHYQIQGQLHVARRSKCFFMVWSPTEHHLETIDYDPQFWGDMEESLDQFYMSCLLPEIADPRAPRGLPVRDPEYILEASWQVLEIGCSLQF